MHSGSYYVFYCLKHIGDLWKSGVQKNVDIYTVAGINSANSVFVSIFMPCFFICDIIIWRKEKETGLLFPYFSVL